MVWWGGTGRCGKGRGGGLFLVLSEKVNGHQVRNAVVLCAHETFRVTRSSFLFSPPLSLFYYYFYYSSYLLFNPSLPSTISYRFFYLVLPRNECFFLSPPSLPRLNEISSFPPLVRTTPIRFIITTESYTSPALPSNWPRYVTSWHRTRSVVASFNADKPPLLPFHAVTFLVNLRLLFSFSSIIDSILRENRACPNPAISAGYVSALIFSLSFFIRLCNIAKHANKRIDRGAKH